MYAFYTLVTFLQFWGYISIIFLDTEKKSELQDTYSKNCVLCLHQNIQKSIFLHLTIQFSSCNFEFIYKIQTFFLPVLRK